MNDHRPLTETLPLFPASAAEPPHTCTTSSLPSSPDELPAGVTVVTPTRRLAHQLRSRHDAACAARGLGAWRTPDVVTWHELLRRQFEADRVAGRTALRWLPAAQARWIWEDFVARDAGSSAVLASAGLGALAYRSWNLLHQYRIPYDALDAGAGVESAAFARWVAKYRHWLQAGQWLDPALAAAAIGALPTATPVHFVGFAEWTPEQRAFMSAQHAHGVPIKDCEARDEASALKADIVECNDFDSELETATRWAAQWLQVHPTDRVGLIVPGLDCERHRVREALDRVLVPGAAVTDGPAPESTAYELAAARPLSERPVADMALRWLDVARGSPAEAGALNALLLGSHDGAAEAERFPRAELDVSLRRWGVALHTLAAASAAARRGGCVATADVLERLAVRAEGWGRARLPSAWALEFAGALRDVGWPGTTLDTTEHQAVQRWHALLGEFGASDEIQGPLRAGSALLHLRDLARHTSFEPQEIAAPLLVIDPDTAIGMQFDAIWICGLDASRWPAPASPDPFLPREWQVRQQVPSATAELAQAAAQRALLRLTQSARIAIASVPAFDKDAPLLPSAMIAQLPRCANLELWTGRSTTHVLFDARPALETLVDGDLPVFSNHDVARGGTRLLELQSACPFRAAIELRLGGRQLEEPALGVLPAERGRLIHAVLQEFWSDVREQSTLRAMPAEVRAARVRDLASKVLVPLRAAADPVRDRLLELEQGWLEARVLELLEQDAAREPFTVVQIESPHVLDLGGVQIRVKLDRVDRLSDGTYALIDYKTGASTKPTMWMGERPELPQLPLYARTVAMDEVGAVAFGVVRKGDTGYAGFAHQAGKFSNLQPFDPARKPFQDYVDWKGLLSQWQRRVEALAREYAGGDARLAPNPKRACEFCHLPGVCRSAQALVGVDAQEAGDDAE
jgi:probable DNA repair protein